MHVKEILEKMCAGCRNRQVFRRKYNRGTHLAGKWVLDGIQLEERAVLFNALRPKSSRRKHAFAPHHSVGKVSEKRTNNGSFEVTAIFKSFANCPCTCIKLCSSKNFHADFRIFCNSLPQFCFDLPIY
jgi:hypothetical protein